MISDRNIFTFYIPLSYVDPCGRFSSKFEFANYNTLAYHEISVGFDAILEAGTKFFDIVWGTSYKTIGEVTGLNSGIRIGVGIEPWSLYLSDPSPVTRLTYSERVTELMTVGLGKGLKMAETVFNAKRELLLIEKEINAMGEQYNFGQTHFGTVMKESMLDAGEKMVKGVRHVLKGVDHFDHLDHQKSNYSKLKDH